MFTGIVTAIGEVVSVERHPELTRLVIASGAAEPPPAIGASVAISGVCLTVVAVKANGRLEMTFEAGPETLALTTVGTWAVGTRVNLERSLKVGDELGGHIVSGHVDGIAEVLGICPEGGSTRIGLRAPDGLAIYLEPKGSITLDGVSLTVNEVREADDGTHFAVNIIPHTAEHTTLGKIEPGRQLNVEIDVIARYLERMLASRAHSAA